MSFAVVDLETTGFSPARGDRIVEVGVVLLDDVGRVEQEWATLVNPERDVGATRVHGIRARDVVDAPLFSDIATDLVDLLAGRTLVAHNQAFDVRFLRAELLTHGHQMPESYAALCTMLWSRRRLGAAKLADVCSALGVELTDAHSALGDARATARVLTTLMGMLRGDLEWLDDVARGVFPLAGTGALNLESPVVRDVRTGIREESTEAPLWQRVTVPVPGDDFGATIYLELLANVLDDGLISPAEHSRLSSIAEFAGLDDFRLPELHTAYLDALAAEAVADGTVTESERQQLSQIATILDLPLPQLRPTPRFPASARASSLVSRPTGTDDGVVATGNEFVLSPGCRVVFTGTMSLPREEWARRLSEAGLTTGGVTKKTAVVIAEDPASQSGKAKNAVKFGIPVVTEAEFAPVFDTYIAMHAG